MNNTQPGWLDEIDIIKTFDARPIISSGGHPMQDVFNETDKLRIGQIFLFITPFLPTPLIDKLNDKGFDTYSKEEPKGIFLNYVKKN